ncbi:MAG: metalloregulator ArsR/SmtB family transcription factor [Scytonematopsis contorta HA4267-MV1]|jgi:ArsR family transcriptional regulator|nr:metalloregulator ArsR/SmtB family transcription factor [Scytonematopsis contorta HA4267-MV1]
MEKIPILVQPEVVTVFHALSDPLRLKVLEFLQKQELCVCDLSEALEVAQSKLSFHLKALKVAGLVNSRQEGRWIYYSLNLPGFAIIEQYLSSYNSAERVFIARKCE